MRSPHTILGYDWRDMTEKKVVRTSEEEVARREARLATMRERKWLKRLDRQYVAKETAFKKLRLQNDSDSFAGFTSHALV